MSREQRHILVAVLGRTPQVLTETLYALCVERKHPVETVWAISTREGYREACKQLLDPQTGMFYQLQHDYPEACARLQFSEANIKVAHDGLLPIADIRTRRDSESFLALILEVLWEQTADPATVLHCSIAGGRKTMSTYLALALQLLARPDDRLYHVLVAPQELEHQRQFYYPPPRPQQITLRDGQIIDTSQAQIDLIDIPFIRLRERVQIDRLSSPQGYRELLAWVQRDIDRSTLPVLTLDPGNHTIIIGDQKIRLQPQRFCLYWYFAERSRTRLSRIAIEDYPAYFEYPQSPYFSSTMLDGLLGRFDLLDPHRKMRGKFIAKVLEDGQLPMSWVLQRIAKINTQIRLSVPGLPALPFYLISSHGKRGTKCYGIKLPGEKIVVKGG